jgi:hypothetical protein
LKKRSENQWVDRKGSRQPTMDIEEQKDDNKYPQIKPVKAKPHIRIPIVSVGFFPLKTLLNFNLCNGSVALLEPNSIVYGQKCCRFAMD